MRNEAMLQEFIELVSIDAISGKENAVAERLTEKMKALGFTVTMDDAGEKTGGECGNLICIREGELEGSLFFSSHMDRMPNGFGIKPVEKDGVLYSDGTTILAADDLAGASIILNGLRTMINSGKPLPRLEVVFTVQEEPGVWGSRALDMAPIQSKVGFVFDATDKAGRFVVTGPGRYSIDVEVTGRAAHAGADPEKGIDAAKAVCEMITTLKTGRIDAESTANFPILHGITARNSVCDKAGFKGEARSRNEDKLMAYMKEFDEICRGIAEKYGAGIEIVTDYSYPPLNVPADAPALQLAKRACDALGLTYNPEPGGGGMDTNWYSARGMSCIGCGCGYAKNHTTSEYLNLEEFFKAGEMCVKMIELYAQDQKAK